MNFSIPNILFKSSDLIFHYILLFLLIFIQNMQSSRSQKLKKGQSTLQNDDLDTNDSKSVVSSKDVSSNSGITTSKPAQKKVEKQKGWLDFINQKLNEWPLWAKLTSGPEKQTGQNKLVDRKEEAKSEKQVNRPRTYKCNFLPWRQYMDRGFWKPLYRFYHNKEQNMTYFYNVSRKSREDKHEEVSQMPTQEMLEHTRILFVMRMDRAKQQLLQEAKQRIY